MRLASPIYGTENISTTEHLLQSMRIHVVVSRRRLLHTWSPRLCSPFWRLYFNGSPGASVRVGDRTTDLRPGVLYLIPAGLDFQTALTQPVDHAYLHFYFTGLPVSLHQQIFNHVIPLPEDPLLNGLTQRWLESCDAEHEVDLTSFAWSTALAQATFAVAVDRLDGTARRALSAWLHQAHEVRPALDAIEKRLADPPSNAELAALCSLSTSYFIRVFRRNLGVTPARYSLERRLAVASGWLIGSMRSIEHIAEATGFGDRFHFSRVFKARFGNAPAEYRRLQRQRLAPSASPVIRHDVSGFLSSPCR